MYTTLTPAAPGLRVPPHPAPCACSYLAGLASLASRVVETVQFRHNPWFLDNLDHAPTGSPTGGSGDDSVSESPSPLVAGEDSGDPRMQALRERALPQCDLLPRLARSPVRPCPSPPPPPPPATILTTS